MLIPTKVILLAIIFSISFIKNALYINDVQRSLNYIQSLPHRNATFSNISTDYVYTSDEVYTYVLLEGKNIRVTYPGPPNKWVSHRNSSFCHWVDMHIGSFSEVHVDEDIGFSDPMVLDGMLEDGYNTTLLLIMMLIAASLGVAII